VEIYSLLLELWISACKQSSGFANQDYGSDSASTVLQYSIPEKLNLTFTFQSGITDRLSVDKVPKCLCCYTSILWQIWFGIIFWPACEFDWLAEEELHAREGMKGANACQKMDRCLLLPNCFTVWSLNSDNSLGFTF